MLPGTACTKGLGLCVQRSESSTVFGRRGGTEPAHAGEEGRDPGACRLEFGFLKIFS